MKRLPHLLLPLMVFSAHAVECIAHRGDSIHHPDNTLEAVGSAWKAGADVVELDVRMTADGVLVLFHDADLRKKPISGMTHAELDAAVADHHVPSLEECLKDCGAGQRLLLDLKETSDGYLRKVLKAVGKSTSSGCEVMMQSASFEVLESLRKMAPKGTRLFLVTDLKPTPVAAPLAEKLVKREVQGITAKDRPFVDKDFVRAFQSRGLEYYVWTINPPGRIEHYAGLGVDGIITDDPVSFRKVLPRQTEPQGEIVPN